MSTKKRSKGTRIRSLPTGKISHDAMRVLKRGSFLSVQDLQAKVLAFIDYYNVTMAKPFKWTSQGKALTI